MAGREGGSGDEDGGGMTRAQNTNKRNLHLIVESGDDEMSTLISRLQAQRREF